MTIEANKALIQRYIELWETGHLALADEILAPGYIDHTHPDRPPGPEPVKQEITAFRTAFPDAQIAIEAMIGEGDLVAFRFIMRGTYSAPFAGFPPTGQTVVLTGVDFVRIVDGKIHELWSMQDTFSWAQQIGYKISR